MELDAVRPVRNDDRAALARPRRAELLPVVADGRYSHKIERRKIYNAARLGLLTHLSSRESFVATVRALREGKGR